MPRGMATLHDSLMRKVTATPKVKDVLTGPAGRMGVGRCELGVVVGIYVLRVTVYPSVCVNYDMQMLSREQPRTDQISLLF